MNDNGVIQNPNANDQEESLEEGIGAGTYPVLVKGDNIIVPNFIYQKLSLIKNKIIHISSFILLFDNTYGDQIQHMQDFKGFLLIDESGKIFEISSYRNKDGDFKSEVSELLTIPREHFVDDNKEMICKIIDSIVKGYGGGYCDCPVNENFSDWESKNRSMGELIGYYEEDDEKHLEILTNLHKHMKISILDMINKMCQIKKKKDDEVKALQERIKFLTSHIESMPDSKLFFNLEKHFYDLAK
jgi:hypothetical protein